MNWLKNIINTNTSERISSLIEKNNDNLINKTISIVNEIIPRTHETLYKQLHETIISFQRSISEDTNKLINSTNNDSLKDFIVSFESKSSSMLQTVQQPIYAFRGIRAAIARQSFRCQRAGQEPGGRTISRRVSNRERRKPAHSAACTKTNRSLLQSRH